MKEKANLRRAAAVSDSEPAIRPGGFFGKGPAGGLGMPVEKVHNFRSTFRRLLVYLKPHRWQLLFVFLLTILGTLFEIISPKILGQATTRLFEGSLLLLRQVPGAGIDFSYIAKILLYLGGLYIFSSIFNYLTQCLMARIAQKTVFTLRNDLNDKLARLPLKFFDTRAHGDVLSRVTNDIDNISSSLQQGITQFITAVVSFTGTITMMLTINPLLTLIALVSLPLSLLLTALVTRRSQKYFAAQQNEMGVLNGYVEETLGGFQIVKAFSRQQHSRARFRSINDRLCEAGWKAQFVSGILMPLINLISNLGYVLICVVGGIFVTQKLLAIGDVQAFLQYARQVSHPVVQFAHITNIIQSSVASAARVFEILDEAEETPDSSRARIPVQPAGGVTFKNIRFGYSEDLPVIDNLSIDIRPGQTVAIVGPTGAGKTTLVNLLMRFYDLGEGRITINGVDIRDLKRESLRSLFGLVLQETWLFKGTIRENIAYGREGVSEEEIIRAAQAAHVDHFIRTLPEGYDTILNEEASNISLGQRQLLTLARAVLADPAILILDEATSSVDTRTEVIIQQALHALMKGRTCFVIAHRLATIREADLILVMNQGKVVEKGSHSELLAQGGLYADLYQSQFAGAEAGNTAAGI
jgi:ATP-binding cassette subfamily B protein